MKYTFLLSLLLLLASCATQQQARKFFDEHSEELAAYVDQQEAFTKKYGQAYAARHFPPRLYPPALYAAPGIRPDRLSLQPALPERQVQQLPSGFPDCPACPPAAMPPVYLPDTLQLDSLNRELKVERLANQALRTRLHDTEADRDYWREMNRKKRWALIAMAIFALLYILFKVLAYRARETTS